MVGSTGGACSRMYVFATKCFGRFLETSMREQTVCLRTSRTPFVISSWDKHIEGVSAQLRRIYTFVPLVRHRPPSTSTISPSTPSLAILIPNPPLHPTSSHLHITTLSRLPPPSNRNLQIDNVPITHDRINTTLSQSITPLRPR
jgi:hypothetical protein